MSTGCRCSASRRNRGRCAQAAPDAFWCGDVRAVDRVRQCRQSDARANGRSAERDCDPHRVRGEAHPHHPASHLREPAGLGRWWRSWIDRCALRNRTGRELLRIEPAAPC